MRTIALCDFHCLPGDYPDVETVLSPDELILAVELPRRTKHPILAICAALLAAEINIHYAYPLLLRPHGPTLALYVDEPTLAQWRAAGDVSDRS